MCKFSSYRSVSDLVSGGHTEHPEFSGPASRDRRGRETSDEVFARLEAVADETLAILLPTKFFKLRPSQSNQHALGLPRAEWQTSYLHFVYAKMSQLQTVHSSSECSLNIFLH